MFQFVAEFHDIGVASLGLVSQSFAQRTVNPVTSLDQPSAAAAPVNTPESVGVRTVEAWAESKRHDDSRESGAYRGLKLTGQVVCRQEKMPPKRLRYSRQLLHQPQTKNSHVSVASEADTVNNSSNTSTAPADDPLTSSSDAEKHDATPPVSSAPAIASGKAVKVSLTQETLKNAIKTLKKFEQELSAREAQLTTQSMTRQPPPETAGMTSQRARKPKRRKRLKLPKQNLGVIEEDATESDSDVSVT